MRRLAALLACLALPVSTFAQASFTPDPVTVNRDAAARGNNMFAASLYGLMRGQGGNFFFSPGSLSTSLAMVLGGARGETATEIARVLHIALPPALLHPAMATLVRQMNASGALHNYQLSMVNGLWLDNSASFNPDFVTLVQTNYGAALNTTDFNTQPDTARSVINAWAAQQTDQRVRNMLAPGAVGPQTRLVIASAVTFKGDWQQAFDPNDTHNEPFQVYAGKSVSAQMMHRTGRFGYYQGPDFQALQIPYKGRDLAMVLLLPGAPDGISGLELEMNPDALALWCERLDNGLQTVKAAFPRFSVERDYSFGPMLARLGMPSAFKPGTADFSGLMDARTRLPLSAVFQKAYVAVDEEGVETTATTSEPSHAIGPNTLPPTFRANHPFVFLIRDTRSGSILFMGRVIDPTAY